MKSNKLLELSDKSVTLVTINFHHVTYKYFIVNNVIFYTYDYFGAVTTKTLIAFHGLMSVYSGFYNPFSRKIQRDTIHNEEAIRQ